MGTATLLYRCLEIPSPQMLLVLLAAFPLWHTTPEKRNPPHSTHTSTLTRAPHTQFSSPSLFQASRCFACSLEVPLSARGHDIPYPAPNILDQRRPDQTRPDQTRQKDMAGKYGRHTQMNPTRATTIGFTTHCFLPLAESLLLAERADMPETFVVGGKDVGIPGRRRGARLTWTIRRSWLHEGKGETGKKRLACQARAWG